MNISTNQPSIFTVKVLQTISALNPADNTTYYGDTVFGLTTNATLRKYGLPYNCTLIGAMIKSINNTTNASSEASVVSINNITQGTNVVLSSNVVFNGTAPVENVVNVTGLSTQYTAGDNIQAKILTATWATNPTAVFLEIDLYFTM